MRRIVVVGVLTVLLSAREAGTATVTSDTSALLSICEANPSAAVCTTGAYTRQCNQRSNPKCSGVTATGAVWQNGTDPCFTGWAGVTCDEGKERVTVLELGSGGISRLPRNVSNLTALRILILANNSLEELPPGHTNLVSLSDLALDQNRLTTLPGNFGELGALASLTCTGNAITALPESFGRLSSLTRAWLSRNKLKTLPKSFGGLAKLEDLALDGNQLSSLPDSFVQLKSLTKLKLQANDFPDGYAYPSPGMCGSEFHPDLDDGIDICSLCPKLGPALSRVNLGIFLILLGAMASLYAIWAISSAHWRPEPRAVACVVYFGRRADAHDAAISWREMLLQRFDSVPGAVHLDHDENTVEPGDEVLIDDMPSSCTSKTQKLNGQTGTVTVPPAEDKKGKTIARVAFLGSAGIKKIPTANLTVQPIVNEDPATAPAICLCVCMEWLTSESFMADVLLILAQRCGATLVDDSADLSLFHNKAQGVLFALCGADNFTQHPVIRQVDAMLNLQPQQIVWFDTTGGDIVTTNSKVKCFGGILFGGTEETTADLEQGLRDLEDFCLNHRHTDEHANATDELRSAVFSQTQQASKATQTANNFKTVVAQLQQSFTLLGIDMNWPTFVEDVRLWVGTVVLLDVGQFAPLECFMGDENGQIGEYLVDAVMYIMSILFLSICFMCGYIGHAKSKWSKKGDAGAAETAAHLTNCGWALFTFLAPIALGKTLWLITDDTSRSTGTGTYLYFFGVVATSVLLMVPGIGYLQMVSAKKNGLLTSRSFEARCGWLCARYRIECFWFELLFLQARYLTMAVATLAGKYPTIVAVVYMLTTLVMLGLQLKLMPFRETEAEAKHWTSSNKIGAIGHCSSMIISMSGLAFEETADMSEGMRTALTALIMLLVIVPTMLAILSLFADVVDPADMSMQAFGMTVAGAEAPRREDQTDEEDQFANPLSTFDQGQGEEAEQLEPALALFETTLEIQKKLLQVVSSTVSEMGWRSLFERRSLRMGILVVDFESFKTICRDDCQMTRDTMNDAQIDALFKQVDVDRSDDVTLEEFLEWMNTEHKRSTPKRLQGTLKAAMESLEMALGWKAVFDSFDADGDGELSKQEFIMAIRQNCGQEMHDRNVWITDDELSELFYAADTDGSGELDYDEFVELMTYEAGKSDGDEV